MTASTANTCVRHRPRIKIKLNDNKPKYTDASAGKALNKLPKQGEISGDQMQKAIVDGTKDLDSQAAGNEYKDFKQYADKNWSRMSPDAREKFRVYEKTAKSNQAKGKTGIPQGEYNKMVGDMKSAGYNDKTAGKAIEGLKDKKGPITGDDMQKAIVDGTKDLDSQAAGKEYKDFKKFYNENQDRMTPEAKAKFGVYEKYAKNAQKNGKTGIKQSDYNKMVGEMKTAGYADKGAGKAIEDLKAKNPNGTITGDQMQQTIVDGTKDLDNQAAGKEYKDFKKFATENWDRMSPDAREKFRVYEKTAKNAQKNGQTGIKKSDYDKMVKDMKGAGYKDASTGKAIEGLKAKKGEISGDDMQKAIVDGTKDLDAQAAGKEYADLKKFANENWGRMSPDAKEKFRVYEKYAKNAQKNCQTGIKQSDYNKMVGEMNNAGYKDATAGKAIEGLKSKPGTISGNDMEKAIIDGTKDLDNQAAGKEYADLKKFANENWSRMSPEARQKFRTYEKYAKAAQAEGRTGIRQCDYNCMVNEMRTGGYKDAGAGKAIDKLKNKPGTISGNDMQNTIIDATKDLDNQAAGKEYADLKKFATENWDRMSPDARQKFRVYEKAVHSAQARGMTGIPQGEYNQMVRDMKGAGYNDASAGQAIEGLKNKQGPITGDDMQRAIFEGTADLDSNAATKEYADFANFAKENWHRMTPDAREKFRTYDRYAASARARGHTGIPQNEYNAMKHEMRCSGYQDASAGAEIEKLKNHPGMIDSNMLIGAISRGVADRDGQAAGREFADFFRFALQNWNRMTPDAQAAFGAYTQHVQQAWLSGQTGIHNFGGMVNDMRASADLLFMRQGFFRI